MRGDLTAEQAFVMGEMARADLYFFSRFMFWQRRGYKWQRARHHRLICDALMRVFSGEVTRLIINIPPRYSKTELAVVNFAAWALGHAPDAEFIHTSYSATLAAGNSANVRDMLRHEAYSGVFSSRVDEAAGARDHWKTTAGGVFYSAGAGGTITGFGAGKMRDGFGGAIIIDDPHKADEARSDTIRQGVIDWYLNTLESRKNDPQRTPIILIMQRLHEKDLSGFLLAGGNGEKWEHLNLSAWNDDHTPLWPEKHSADELERMEAAAPYVFAGQYRQRPAPPEGGTFKPGMIEVVPALPVGQIRWVRGWDLAASTSGKFTAGAKLGVLADGRVVIGGVERERLGPDKRDELILKTARTDGISVRQSIPQDPGQAGLTQRLAFARLLQGLSVHFSPESGDKLTRAEPFASQVNAGNVLMLKGPWNDALKDEMRLFPNGEFSDQVDACSRAYALLIAGASSTGFASTAARVALPT